MGPEQIKEVIQKSLPEAEVYVVDPDNDGNHFQAVVVSSSFQDMTRVEQHQTVMNSLKSALDDESVHALGLKTFTPEKWEKNKSQYGV